MATSNSTYPVVFSWTARYGALDPAPQTGTGPTFAVAATKAGVATVELLAQEQNAPISNLRAVKKVVTTVTVLAPAIPKPVIIGPVVVETGKTYTWSAVQRSPFPLNTNPDLVLRSIWALPDGTTSTANPVTYTMKAGDQAKVRFESWVQEYPNVIGSTELVLRPWTYAFSSFLISGKMLTPIYPGSLLTKPALFAPGRIQYTIVPTTAAEALAMHGEALTYQWALPQGATVINQGTNVVVVEYAQPGTYELGATVADSRGNSTQISAATTVLPPWPFTLAMSLTPADRFSRPGMVRAVPMITSLPAGDILRTLTYTVNGTQVAGPVAGAVNLSLPDPGTYSVTVNGTTLKGVTTSTTKEITLALGDNPACVLKKGGNGTTTLSFLATCSAQRGIITSYRWRVTDSLGTQLSAVTASSISFPPVQIDKGIVTVEVIATTDKGQVGGAVFDLAAGTSTPRP